LFLAHLVGLLLSWFYWFLVGKAFFKWVFVSLICWRYHPSVCLSFSLFSSVYSHLSLFSFLLAVYTWESSEWFLCLTKLDTALLNKIESVFATVSGALGRMVRFAGILVFTCSDV